MTDEIAHPPTVAAVVAAAATAGLAVVPVEFPDGTRTAADAAAAIGCEVAQIVKSLVFVVEDVPRDGDPDTGGTTTDDPTSTTAEVVLALVAGDDRLDPDKLAAAASGRRARRASADEVRAATGVAIGGVAPFGLAGRLRCFVDPGVLRHDEVWAAAGTPRHVFAAEPRALVEAAGARVAEVAGPTG
ncbi:MAG: YbaK/EbsC family protein [Actinomycetota bacterium]|nr:YbaK/EbsC family protein [Actinomycetota bacterium]